MASRLDFSTGGAVNTGNNISSAIANVGSLFDKFMVREEDRAWREQQRQDALDKMALEREDRSLTRAQAKEEFEKKHALDTMRIQSAMTNDGLQAQKYLLEMDKVRADMRDAEEKKASQRAMASAVQSGKFEDAYSQAALDRYGDKVASVVTQNNLAGFSTFDDADKAQLQKDEARALRSALVDPTLATSGAQGRVADIKGTVLPGAKQLLSNEDVREINRVTASRLGVLPEDMTRYADYMPKGRDYAALDKQALEQDKEYKDNLVKMAVAGQRNANLGTSLYMKDGKVDMPALTDKVTKGLATTDLLLNRSDLARARAGIGYSMEALSKDYSQAQIAKGLDFVLTTMREGDNGQEYELNEEQTADAVKRVLDQGIVDTVDRPNSGSSELSADKVIAALGIRPRSAREVSELNFMQNIKDRFATPANMDAEISRRSLPAPQQTSALPPEPKKVPGLPSLWEIQTLKELNGNTEPVSKEELLYNLATNPNLPTSARGKRQVDLAIQRKDPIALADALFDSENAKLNEEIRNSPKDQLTPARVERFNNERAKLVERNKLMQIKDPAIKMEALKAYLYPDQYSTPYTDYLPAAQPLRNVGVPPRNSLVESDYTNMAVPQLRRADVRNLPVGN